MAEQQKNTQNNQQNNKKEPDMNQLRKVRREKLSELQASGKNPFVITKYDVTHHASDILERYEELEGQKVTF